MTWGEDWRARDEVTDMALVGRRDGRNFGYGRQLSYAGPLVLKGMFGDGHYGTVKAPGGVVGFRFLGRDSPTPETIYSLQ
jgi:hypothetical protein